MVGLDTNVLVRYMVQDDKIQAELSRRLIEDACRPDNPGAITLVVLCELVWVLHTAYGFTRKQIAGALRQILVTDCFDVDDHALAWVAFRDYEVSHADYADCVIARLNQARGNQTTYTFDKRAADLPGFTLLT
ncbi:MAG: PIN domain-containing protein [Kiritimatiellia bacterium]